MRKYSNNNEENIKRIQGAAWRSSHWPNKSEIKILILSTKINDKNRLNPLNRNPWVYFICINREEREVLFCNVMQTINIKGMMELENHQWILKIMAGQYAEEWDIYIISKYLLTTEYDELSLVSGLKKNQIRILTVN